MTAVTSTRGGPVSISRALGMVVVTVHGAIDAQMSEQLRHLLADLIDNQGNLDVVIDLRDVDMIDLTGIEVVVEASERMRCKGGRLVLSEARSVESASLGGASVSRDLRPYAQPAQRGGMVMAPSGRGGTER